MGRLNQSLPEPTGNLAFDGIVMGIWNLALFNIDRLLIHEGGPMEDFGGGLGIKGCLPEDIMVIGKKLEIGCSLIRRNL